MADRISYPKSLASVRAFSLGDKRKCLQSPCLANINHNLYVPTENALSKSIALRIKNGFELTKVKAFEGERVIVLLMDKVLRTRQNKRYVHLSSITR